MPGASLVRFVALAAFIVSVALALWLLDAGRGWIVVGVVVAWLIASLVEWIAWSRWEATWPAEPPGLPRTYAAPVPPPPPLPHAVPPVFAHPPGPVAPRASPPPPPPPRAAPPAPPAAAPPAGDEPAMLALPSAPAAPAAPPQPKPDPESEPEPPPPAREPSPAPEHEEPHPSASARAPAPPVLRPKLAGERSFRFPGVRVTLRKRPKEDLPASLPVAGPPPAAATTVAPELASMPEPEPDPDLEREPDPEPVRILPAELEPELLPEPDPEPEPERQAAPDRGLVAREPTVARLDERVAGEPRRWNLWELERAARGRGGTFPGAAEEQAFLLLHLRRFAAADGLLPTEFDGLVRESFGALIGDLEQA